MAELLGITKEEAEKKLSSFNEAFISIISGVEPSIEPSVFDRAAGANPKWL